MLFSFLTVSLVILNASSLILHTSEPNQTISKFKFIGAHNPMSYIQSLKLPNHRNIQQTSNENLQHGKLNSLKRPVVQVNYIKSRNGKENTFLPVRHAPHLPDSYLKGVPSDRSFTTNQIPLPLPLTRTLSENRRRYLESALEQPRPFNFPLQEPRPSEFKKTHKSRKENVRSKVQKVNNIQDILRQEFVANLNHYRMPVGIHISGSFKNLQSSGISKFFQKYPRPQPHMSPSQFNFQHIAFDPFYQYKPKSVSDINSLAMKQFGLNRTKKKNKANMIPGAILQPNGDWPIASDYYLDAKKLNSTMNHFGSQRYLKNEPFSLKLEVYPIRSGKKVPSLSIAGSQYSTTVRPTPHSYETLYPHIPYGLPINPTINHVNFISTQQLYKGKTVQPPLHITKLPMDLSVLATHSKDKKRKEESIAKSSKSPMNQLMVHLNVFPKKKESSVVQNHLYDVITADIHERRYNNADAMENGTSQVTFIDCETGEKNSEEDVQHPDSIKYQRAEAKSVGIGRLLEFGLNETSKFSRNSPDNMTEKSSAFRFPIENLLQFQANDAVV